MAMTCLTPVVDLLMLVVFYLTATVGSVYAFFCNIRYYHEERKLCPKISSHILLWTACELTEKIRHREITCEKVIHSYIQRIKEVNPIINAVVEDRFDIAIEEAKRYDVMLSKTKLTSNHLAIRYPLLGVPITVKESIGVKGMSHSSAQVRLKGVKADKDADVIRLIKEAGGIILLVSNTPELCTNMETFNTITGTTRNPYDTRRTPAGSSGGEAALVGSGASLIGIGSDMLGSIRIPASFCGIWGHKPSAHIVSIDNHSPICNDKKIETILTMGPFTRYQVDLPLILNVILKENVRTTLNLCESMPLHKITIYYSEDFPKPSNINPEVYSAFKNVLNHLQHHGNCNIKKISLKKCNSFTIAFFKYMCYIRDLPDLFENYKKRYYLELLYYMLGKSDLSFNHILLGMVQPLLLCLPQSVFEDCQIQIQQIRNEFCDALGENGVFLLPTHPTVATFNGQIYKKIFQYELTSVFNIVGFPATNCPVGLTSSGLPIGIQVAATTNNDALCLKVAEEIGKGFGGWIPPKFFGE